MIPYGRQDISREDIDAVVAVLQSDFLTQGPLVPEFERAVVARCGASRAVAVNSATSALHIACLALGLDPATGCGPRPSPSWPRPIARSIAAPRSISSTSTRARSTCLRQNWSASSSRPSARGGCRKSWFPCISRAAMRHGSDPRARPALRFFRHRRRLARDRRTVPRPPHRRLPPQRHHRLQLPPGKNHHHRRGRHGADQKRGSGRPHGTVAQPWRDPRRKPDDPAARRPLALRTDRARLQLPHDRTPGGARPEPVAPSR